MFKSALIIHLVS